VDSDGSFFGSVRECPLELEDVPVARDESSKSNTSEILDDASQSRFRV
jgi:hypothetical protein